MDVSVGVRAPLFSALVDDGPKQEENPQADCGGGKLLPCVDRGGEVEIRTVHARYRESGDEHDPSEPPCNPPVYGAPYGLIVGETEAHGMEVIFHASEKHQLSLEFGRTRHGSVDSSTLLGRGLSVEIAHEVFVAHVISHDTFPLGVSVPVTGTPSPLQPMLHGGRCGHDRVDLLQYPPESQEYWRFQSSETLEAPSEPGFLGVRPRVC